MTRGGTRVTGFFHSLDLIVELSYAIVGIARSDAVDKYEALTVSYPLISQCGVFFLTCGIEYLKHASLCVYHDLFSV